MAHAKKKRNNSSRSSEERRYTVRGVRRDPVDVSKLSKALIGLAMAQAEREAQAEHASRSADDVEPEGSTRHQSQPGGVEDA
ncbi:hypothetical protein [Amycolatopsis alkalitolerans]|uniref:Uncharacterized protein n=1 Tax=Amycolatopsis alkalitolerans TaxID=2547244 RepID=A0A5C4LZI5_9PSEU|nr:hypothetical protein [Amycolatopsis alkalitolerans]TNC23705.1 hypothetical protein FG385_20285 [Amycolatopsis alkalitolerans]